MTRPTVTAATCGGHLVQYSEQRFIGAVLVYNVHVYVHVYVHVCTCICTLYVQFLLKVCGVHLV